MMTEAEMIARICEGVQVSINRSDIQTRYIVHADGADSWLHAVMSVRPPHFFEPMTKPAHVVRYLDFAWNAYFALTARAKGISDINSYPPPQLRKLAPLSKPKRYLPLPEPLRKYRPRPQTETMIDLLAPSKRRIRIHRMRAAGLPVREIAARENVSTKRIYQILRSEYRRARYTRQTEWDIKDIELLSYQRLIRFKKTLDALFGSRKPSFLRRLFPFMANRA